MAYLSYALSYTILKLSRYLENSNNNTIPTKHYILFNREKDVNVWTLFAKILIYGVIDNVLIQIRPDTQQTLSEIVYMW